MAQTVNTEMLKRVFQEYLKKVNKGSKKSPNPEDYGIPGTTGGSSTIAPPEASRFPVVIVKLIQFLLFMAIGYLAFANMKPYISICTWLGSGLSDPVLQALSTFPLTGWIMSLGAGTLAFLCGIALWALLQGLQMLPVIILDDPEAILVLMSWVSQFRSVAFKSDDSPLLIQLKQRFNNLPLEWVENLQTGRAIAYVIDGVLVFGFYPPIVGGYERLGVFLAAPAWQDIDWYNVVASLVTMFAIEVLYKVGKLLNSSLELLSERHRAA